jgi:hypothetical protein
MESITAINFRLLDYFGKFENGEANFRVVWSDSQMENRKTKFSSEGIELPWEEVRLLPKYPYLKHVYVLEQLVGIDFSDELTGKSSYEPLWAFVTDDGASVEPKFEYIKVLIETMLEEVRTRGKGPKYTIPENELQTKEAQEHRADILEKMLFGNETPIGDALSHDSAVGYGIRNRNDSRFKKVH